MDQWKAAFKQIYGQTPTKKDYVIAPHSVQIELPKSIEKLKGKGQKRKQLTVKADGEFGSPLKLSKPSNIYSCTNSTNAHQSVAFEECVPSSSDFVRLKRASPPALISPVKNWGHFLALQQNVTKVPAFGSDVDLFKTPSPARMGRRLIVCTNVGQLLTPEKPFDAMPNNGNGDEDGQSEAEKKMENLDEVKQSGEGTSRDAVGIKQQRTKRKSRKQNIAGNFVSVNLRRRQFAPISKYKGKKWKKSWNKTKKR